MTNAGEAHQATNAFMFPLFIASTASLTVLIASLEGDAEQTAGVAKNAMAPARAKPANRWILIFYPLTGMIVPAAPHCTPGAGNLAIDNHMNRIAQSQYVAMRWVQMRSRDLAAGATMTEDEAIRKLAASSLSDITTTGRSASRRRSMSQTQAVESRCRGPNKSAW